MSSETQNNRRKIKMEKEKNQIVKMEISIGQAEAITAALDVYVRLCIGQLSEVSQMVRFGIIPMATTHWSHTGTKERIVAPEEVCDRVDALMMQVKEVLGYPSNGNNGIGHPDIHESGRRAYEIEKVLKKALAENRNPNPAFKGVDYDGLGPRYTKDPAPVAVIVGNNSIQFNEGFEP